MVAKKKAVAKTPVVLPTAAALKKANPPAASTVAALTALARTQYSLEQRISLNDTKGKELRAELFELRTKTIPLAFRSADLSSLALSNGVRVEISDFVTANIKEENAAEAHAWLRKNKYGSLIKNVISCSFGMGEDKKARALKALLKKIKQSFTEKEGVHKQTLQAFAREMLAAGKTLPNCIDVVSIPTSAIIIPKEKA